MRTTIHLALVVGAVAVATGVFADHAASTACIATTGVPVRSDAPRPACTVSIPIPGVPTDVETTAGAVWVAAGMAGIVRVDPSTDRPVLRVRPGGAVTSLAHGLGSVWALDLFGERLLRIDPHTSSVVRAFPVGGLPSAVAVGHGLVWVSSQLASTVAGIDPRTGRLLKLAVFAPGELWPGGLAVGPDGVWVITGAGNEVSLFDPSTMKFRYRLRARGARTLAADRDGAWVGLANHAGILRIDGGRVTRIATGARADGYGPTLASRDVLWVGTPAQLTALDDGIVGRVRLPADTRLDALSAAGRSVWVADQRTRALWHVRLP